MNFSEIFIRRPVLSTVLSLLIFLLGVQGATNLAVREYPKVDESVITVTTAYPGASSELIQGFITTPIAEAVSSVENVDYVSSSSAQSTSTVTVHMKLGADPDAALTETLAKVQGVRERLPQDAEDSVVIKGTGFVRPLMFLSFASDTMSQEQISEYMRRVVQPRMATVGGVAEARVMGNRTFAMRIWLDPLKLAARDVTAAEVANAIRSSNYLAAPGRIQSELYVSPVETETTLRTPEAFGALPLKGSGDDVVRLRDVANIELGPENYDSRIVFGDDQLVFMGIYPTPEANPLDVASAVRAEIPTLRANLLPDMTLGVPYDQTIAIRASIEEVYKTIGEAVVIVILVILLFLGSLRTIIIPAVTIPLSLVGVAFVLFALGYSINLLTLLALVLAIGLVVDDAIVVVENVHRHIEMGETPIDAAINGMREILGPIVAMTITLAAVYAPIGFVQGLTGALFREFAFALAGAVIISGIIAVTLSPMMSARLVKLHGKGHQRQNPVARFIDDFPNKVDRRFAWVAERYHRILEQALASRRIILVLCGVLLATTVIMFQNTQSEFAPEDDIGFFTAFQIGPNYASADYSAEVSRQIDAAFAKIPEVTVHFMLVAGFGPPNTAFGVFGLVPWEDRDRSLKQIYTEAQQIASGIPGAQIYVQAISTLPGSQGGAPVQYVIRSIGGPERVYEVAQEIQGRAMASGKFIFVQNSATYDLPRTRVLIDRDRAAALGVPIADIGSTLNVLLSESWVSRFDRDNRSYEVIPQALAGERLSPEKMGHYYVRSVTGAMVPLSAVTKVETVAGPSAIEQFNQLNSAILSGVPYPGVTMDDALAELRKIGSQVMPDGFFEDFAGTSRLSAQEGNALILAFGFAVIVIYLVLAAQFESFRDPLIIMTAVPLSIFGAMVPLNLGFATLNIYTQLGLITLVGLITKHGILMVQFANERRSHGVALREAIVEAAQVRLRPILMTTAAMVAGVLPLLFASGAGAAARFSIGIVIAAGLSVGTLFTLFVVPVFYTYLAHRDKRAPAVAEPEEARAAAE